MTASPLPLRFRYARLHGEAGKTAAFLTIEGGAALAGDITRVKTGEMTESAA